MAVNVEPSQESANLVGEPVTCVLSAEGREIGLQDIECRCRTCRPCWQPGSFPCCCCRLHWKHFAETALLAALGYCVTRQTFDLIVFRTANWLRNEVSGLLFTILLCTFVPVAVFGSIAGAYAPEKVAYFSPGRFRRVSTLLGVALWLGLAAPQLALVPVARGLEAEIWEKLGGSRPPMATPTSFSFSRWMFRSTHTWGPYGSRGGDFKLETHTYITGLIQRKDECGDSVTRRPWTDHLAMDVYFPDNAGREALAPIVFFTHGGGWTSNDKDFINWSPAYFVERGYAVVSAQYGYTCFGFTVWDMLLQLTTALDHMRAKASSWGFDADRIFLAGDSSGGHLALMLAYTLNSPVCGNWSSCGIRGVFDMYGPKGVASGPLYGPIYRNIFTTLTNSTRQEDWDRASPMHVVSASSPPTVTLQGTWDGWVPFSGSVRFHERLEELGVKHLLVGLPTFTHVPEKGYWGGPAQIHRFVFERFLALEDLNACPGNCTASYGGR